MYTAQQLVSSLVGDLHWRCLLQQRAAYQRSGLCRFGRRLDVPVMPKPVRRGMMASVRTHQGGT